MKKVISILIIILLLSFTSCITGRQRKHTDSMNTYDRVNKIFKQSEELQLNKKAIGKKEINITELIIKDIKKEMDEDIKKYKVIVKKYEEHKYNYKEFSSEIISFSKIIAIRNSDEIPENYKRLYNEMISYLSQLSMNIDKELNDRDKEFDEVLAKYVSQSEEITNKLNKLCKKADKMSAARIGMIATGVGIGITITVLSVLNPTTAIMATLGGLGALSAGVITIRETLVEEGYSKDAVTRNWDSKYRDFNNANKEYFDFMIKAYEKIYDIGDRGFDDNISNAKLILQQKFPMISSLENIVIATEEEKKQAATLSDAEKTVVINTMNNVIKDMKDAIGKQKDSKSIDAILKNASTTLDALKEVLDKLKKQSNTSSDEDK